MTKRVTVVLMDHQFRDLDAEAEEYGIDVSDLLERAADAMAEGLRRPGSWEAEHVEALAPYWRGFDDGA